MNLLWLILFMMLPVGALAYVGWHVWVMLPFAAGWKSAILVCAILSFLMLFLDVTGRLDSLPLPLAQVLYAVGTSSLIVLLYAVLTFLVLDVGRCLHLVPRSLFYANGKTALAIALFLTFLLFYGYVHYRQKVRVPLELNTRKELPHDYKIVMASDLHLGYHNPRRELARWVDMMNAEAPDLILIAGDIIDVSVRPLVEEGMAAEWRRLTAPVYACLGNHEYYSGTPAARQFYRDAGIHLLSDTAVVIDSALVVIGRDDRTNKKRKSLEALTGAADTSKYLIVLDHQPYNLAEACQAGIDFQLSGHTHRGQVWPISWVTDYIYECSWGRYRCGSTEFYVSSGLGIWGGKFRIGTQSEYVVATLRRHPPR